MGPTQSVVFEIDKLTRSNITIHALNDILPTK